MFKSLAFAASALLSVASAYDGDGTFYGAGGNGAAGACMLQPGFNGIGVTVAMNAAQFPGACGRCVVLYGNGNGQGGAGSTPIFGPLYAYVDNECPECKYGDIDVGLGGDGRWRISWDFVDCNTARGAGSNMPAPTDHPIWKQRRSLLRGNLNATMEAYPTIDLAPGFMVTKDGIRLISDVVAEQKKAAGQN